MKENLSLKILEEYIEIDKIADDIKNKMFKFIAKANELVELSEDMYQIERTIKLNKISLKGYILDSSCCKMLEENNISNYSIEELKEYFSKYERILNQDCTSYFLAISLYELLENIENLIDNKIELEMNKLSKLVPIINKVKNITDNNYESLYNQVRNKLINDYLNENLIDDKAFNICIQIMNDIFNYYISGYPDIPEV